MAYAKETYKVNSQDANTKSNKGDKKRRSFTSDVRSKTEQPGDFYFLCLHEFNLTLLGLVESSLGLGAFRLEGFLQFSHSLHRLVAIG